MWVYIVGFVFSSFCMWLSEKRTAKKFFGFLAIGILTYISTVRGLDIGIDIKFYVLKTYSTAQLYQGNLLQYMSYNPDQVEPLYLLIEYIAANVFKNVHYALFMFSVITNTFIFFAVKNLRDRLNVTMGWIAYCLLFYSVTLNLMRQFIAISIIFYLFSNVSKLNWKRTILLSLLASGFHISGLMGIFLYAVYNFFKAKSIRRTLLKPIGVVCFLSLPFIVDIALRVAVNIGLLNGKFLIYLNNGGDIALGNIVFRCVGLLSYLLFLYKNKSAGKDDWNIFVLYIAIIDVLFLVNNGLFSLRIGKIFSVFEIVYFVMGMNLYNKKNGTQMLISIIIVIFMFVYWYYQFIILNSGMIYPYIVDKKLF